MKVAPEEVEEVLPFLEESIKDAISYSDPRVLRTSAKTWACIGNYTEGVLYSLAEKALENTSNIDIAQDILNIYEEIMQESSQGSNLALKTLTRVLKDKGSMQLGFKEIEMATLILEMINQNISPQHTDLLPFLIEAIEYIVSADDGGDSPLHWATKRGLVDLARLLLERDKAYDKACDAATDKLARDIKGVVQGYIPPMVLRKNKAEETALDIAKKGRITLGTISNREELTALLEKAEKEALSSINGYPVN